MKKITLFLLTILISCSAWAWNITNGSYIYYANTAKWENEINFFIGNSGWSQGYKMTQIPNTYIYYVQMPQWDNYGEFAIINVLSTWGGEGQQISNRKGWALNSTNIISTNAQLNKYSLIYPTTLPTIKFTTNSNADGYKSFLNYTQTINVTTDDKESTDGGTIQASSYQLATANTTSASSGSTFGAKTTISAAYTATVTLEATAQTGYKFVGWYEGSTSKSTNTTYTYTAENATKTITAKFEANTYTITTESNGNGTVTGGGSGKYNTTKTLTAKPNTGYHFEKWHDSNTENPRTVTITANATYTATFAINTYNVSVSANNEEWGTVSGAGTYAYGTIDTLTATPNDGYKFVKWNDENTDNPRTIKVTSAGEYTAIFEKLPEADFDDPSTLVTGKTYGKLTYQLTMPDNRWYWIVLPYNVNVSAITTSTGGGWEDLVFTEYDAEKRAKGENGWINWKTEYTNEGKAIPTQLQANKGYVIGPKNDPFDQDGDFVVTFPSASLTNTVAREATDLNTTNTGGETINDNWNIIGTGLYHNASLKGINYVALPAVVNGKDSYEYKYITSKKEPFFTEQIGTNSFAPFTAFFVQHGSTYSAEETAATTSAELAPVARAKAQEQEQIYLINMNEAHTVVILNAEGSEGYTAGEDFLEMNIGSRIEMIYSFDAEDALAFNHRATEAQSIALGGYVATAGEQTISLDAYNGNAEAVTLIDNVTGTTTDLLAEDYTFTAEVGSLDGRFTIVFAAQKAGSDTTVDCYNSIANQVIAYGTADHCTVSGLTAGEAIVVYNTMGQLVFATTADSETITLPSLTAGNYLILHNGTTNKVTLR